MWINERGDGVKTCLDCGREAIYDGGTYGSGMLYCRVHGVDGFDPKRRANAAPASDAERVVMLKASIDREMAARGYGPCYVRRCLGMWLAEHRTDVGDHARVERESEVEATEALARLLGVVS